MSTFALVDVNNFYASCEQLFEPRLRGRPVVVLSNNDGCVVSRSQEAKAIGLPMGAPWHQLKAVARRHGVVALSSNYALYADMSNRVVEILSGFAPDIEVYSIDESFLDLSGFGALSHGNLAAYGQSIRQRVRQWVGLPVCVGIARTKTLAKLANHLAKKHACFEGVCDFDALTPAEQHEWMARHEVGEVWGVGRRIGQQLQAMGIRTVLDLKHADEELIRRTFSVVMQRTVQELRGLSCLALEQVTSARQQIMSSRSFGRPVYTLEDLSEAVSAYVCNAAQRLRAQACVAGSVMVSIRTNPFKTEVGQYSRSVFVAVPQPTADSRVLCDVATRLLQTIYRRGYEYQKAAVMLSELHPEVQRQHSLFAQDDEAVRARSRKLMATVDAMNLRLGRGTVSLASAGIEKTWAMRRERVSPQYTTDWGGVPKVLAV